MTDHLRITDYAPKSIYPTGTTGGLREILAAGGTEMNLYEAVSTIYTDPAHLSGTNLDRVGKLFGVRRSGRSDSQYIEALVVADNYQVATSIPELVEVAGLFGTAELEEYCYPAQSHRFQWDGKHYLKGKDTIATTLKPMCVRLRSTGEGAGAAMGDFVSSILIQKNPTLGVYLEPRWRLQAATDFGAYTGTPAPDEIGIYYKEIQRATLPVSITGGACEIEIYETLSPGLDEIRLRSGGIEIAAASLDPIQTAYNITAFVRLEGF